MAKTRTVERYWSDIGEKILAEIERRLSEGDSAQSLPGTLLMRLAEKYIQFLEKQADAKAGEEVEWLTPLQAIDQEGLPDETKIEILSDYIGRLEQDHITATARLEELRGTTPLHEPQSSA